ncbi:MAG: type II toxin-antitoxin system VapC family toxin [Prochlorococcaceae cyanobacterium]
MTLVLDASMALAWIFERESAVEAEQAQRLLDRCGAESWVVPALWHLEVANALVVAERRGVIQPELSGSFLERLDALPIDTEPELPSSRRDGRLSLARRYGLSIYDATYLELCLRLGARLASHDRRLLAAAQAAGVCLS